MYQAVFYDYKTHTYYLRDDKSPKFQEIKYYPTYYKRVASNIEGSLPVLTGGYAIPTQTYNKDDKGLLEKDINKELVLLRDMYYKFDDVVPSWHSLSYLDIETEMGGALTYEYIKSAPMPLTSIAVIDINTKIKYCFIVDKSKKIQSIEQPGKHIIPCSSEKDLIKTFLNKWEEIDSTIVATWNGSFFDIPYLYYRIKNVFSEKEANRLSPIKKVSIQEWDESNPIRLGGINHLDYMLLHKKYITKQEPSYKLGSIGEKYVNLGKIEYEGNLNTLFEKDKNLFIDYNLRDVEILEALEGKLKFIELTILLCHDCLVPYDQIYYTTVLNEGKVLKYLKRKKIVSNNKPTTDHPELKGVKDEYAGGFLLQPSVGLHKWGADFDATSHYPRIIIDLNIGNETLIGWIENNDKYNCWLSLEELKEMDPESTLTLHRVKGDSKLIKVKNIIKFIETENVSIAASGAIFDTSKKSVLGEILENGFDLRQSYKKIMKEAGKNKDWEKYKLYELKSTAIKYFINGCYGALALPGFRYSDGRFILSKAVTLSGQRICKEVIKEMNSYMEEDLKRSFSIRFRGELY